MHKTPEITRLIHENFWTILSFVLARPSADQLLNERFHGEWKYLQKTIYGLAEVRADRALLELATQLRVLDDAEGLSDYFKQVGKSPLGSVTQADGSTTDLHFRDMTNKVIHAASFEWKFDADPSVVCHPHDPSRWRSADIKIVALMAVVGGLIV
jgi:hypothetical protein